MAPKLLIAHAKSEESFAEKLVEPLRQAGYDVSYQGTVLVGESVVEETERLLAQGVPVVLCGTERAAGNTWVGRLVRAARQIDKGMLFIVQMEEEADVESFAFGEKIARYWQDPNRAIAELIKSLHQHYPVEESQASTLRVSAAEKRYRELLLETCDIVNLANLPEQDRHIAQRQHDLKLRGLYIPLRVQVEAARSTEPDDEKEQIRWEALEQRRMGTMPAGGETQHRISVGERLKESKRLVVLGDPGGGKTTLTRWIATAYLLRLKQDSYWKEIPDVQSLPDADWLPIIVRCRDLDLDSLTGSLDDILRHTLRRAELSDADAAGLSAMLRTRLDQGSALLMLDGLDEITNPPARARFCQQLEQIVVAYSEAPIIATSRIVGYREMGYKLGRGFEHLTLAELAPEDKDEFARRWCLLTELPERVAEATKQLIQDIHSSDRIERLTGNPMLLTTMALVKRKVGKLPSRRADLYWEAVQVLLNWRREVDEPLDWREALPQLEYVAYDMSDRGVQQVTQSEILDLFSRMREAYPSVYPVRNRSPQEFLHRLEARTGILVEAGHVRRLGILEPVYEFRHLTFQEYLAARALVDGSFPGYNPSLTLAEQVGPLAGRTGQAVPKFGGEGLAVVEQWREALRLCTAMCSDKDIDSVMLAILTARPGESEEVARARANEATLCLADEPNVSEAVAEQVLWKAADHLGDQRVQRNVALMQIVGTRWADRLREILLDRFSKQEDWVYSAGLLGAEIAAEQALLDEAKLAEWSSAQVGRLQGGDGEATDAGLSIMVLAFREKGTLVPGLIQALIDNLFHGSHRAIAAAWALGWLAGGPAGVHEPLWTPDPDYLRRLLSFVSDRRSEPEAVRFVSWVLGRNAAPEAVQPLSKLPRRGSPKKSARATKLWPNASI